jgi:hypothetical protein
MMRDDADGILEQKSARSTHGPTANLALPFHLRLQAPRSLTNPSKRLYSNFVDHAIRRDFQWTGLTLENLTKSREMAACHAKVAT